MTFFQYITKAYCRIWGTKLEKGSLTGRITGKSYNRCRRIHQLLAAAMDILYFREFDSRFGNERLSVINDGLRLIKETKIFLMFLKGSY